MRTWSSVAALIVLILLLTAGAAGAESFVLTVLHTNDVHGRVVSFDDGDLGENVGGYARRATIVQRIRAENPHTLLLDAGDMFTGTALSAIFKGEPDVLAALLVGYDALAIGNHEFDFGQDVLKGYVDYLPIPMLGANIVYADGTPFAPGHVVFEINGARVLVLGLVTTTTYTSTHPKNVVGLDFLDPVATTLKVMDEHAGEYDIFIVLSHLGLDVDIQLARRVSGIDAIIGGHTHTLVDKPLFVGDTIIAQAGEWGRYLGRVDLEVVDKRVVAAASSVIPVTGDVEPNPVVEAMLQELYGRRIAAEMERVVGYSPVDLVRTPVGTVGDSNIGNFVTDALLWDTGADIAVYNRSGIRADIPAGPLTIGELYSIEPFGNTVMTIELNQAQMISLFDHMAARGGEQVAGATYVVADGKARNILVDGEPLADRTYVVATIDFLASGGSRYTMLADGRNQRTYDVVRETLVRFLEENPDYVFQVDGRITGAR